MPKTTLLAPNPFSLLMDPQGVHARMARSRTLNQLQRRQYFPLECAVVHCASAELAEFDRKIDPFTVYLAPGDWVPPVRPVN